MEYTIEHGEDTYDLVFTASVHGKKLPPTREHPGEDPWVEIEIEEIGKNGAEMQPYDKDHPDYKLIEGLLQENNGKHYSNMEEKFMDMSCDDSDDDDRYERSIYRLRR